MSGNGVDIAFYGYADGKAAQGSGLTVVRGYGTAPAVLVYPKPATETLAIPGGLTSDGAVDPAGTLPSYLQ